MSRIARARVALRRRSDERNRRKLEKEELKANAALRRAKRDELLAEARMRTAKAEARAAAAKEKSAEIKRKKREKQLASIKKAGKSFVKGFRKMQDSYYKK